MALIACPDCGKQVSDEARSCPACGFPVAARVAQMKREEEERVAAAAAEKERQARRRLNLFIGLGIAVFVLFAYISSSVSTSGQSSTTKTLYKMDGQTQSLTPGSNAFSASGKLKFTYSCQASTTHPASVQFVLEDLTSSVTVWEKTITCSISGPAKSGSDTIQVKAASYDIGATVNGDAAWTMLITQT